MLVAVMLEGMLADLGHEVVGTASSADQAIEMARREPLDFAILDVNLDGQEVYPVAEALAARGIPFAFATGYGRQRLPEPHRARPILRKPFQQPDLERIVTQIFPPETGH